MGLDENDLVAILGLAIGNCAIFVLCMGSIMSLLYMTDPCNHVLNLMYT